MSFLDCNLRDAKVLHTVEPGKEYRLRIVGAEEKTSESGRRYINARAIFVDYPSALPIWFPIFGVSPDQDDYARARAESDLKTLALALNYPGEDGIDADMLKGLEGTAIVGIREYEGREQNTITRWVASTAPPPVPGVPSA